MGKLGQSLRAQHLMALRRSGGYCKRGHLRIPENLYAHGECKLCHNRKLPLPTPLTGEEVWKYLQAARKMKVEG